MDMTKDSIGKSIILFAIPLLVSSIIQQMYNTVDLLFVGNILGKDAAAAVGASSMLITCIIGFFSGIAVGTNVVLARTFGTGDENEFKKGIHTALTVSFIGGVVLTIVGIIGSEFFLKLMNTPEEIMNSALEYIRIYFISITSMLVYNIGSGIIRSSGNSRIPMIAQFIGGIINIAVNALFILVLELGIKGSAWATCFSQTTAAILVVLYIIKDKKDFNLNLRDLKIDNGILKKIAFVGIPAGIQTLVISLSNVVVQSYINSLDIDSIAAFTAYFKVELLLYYPIVAIGQAIITFTGQNIGANKISRVKKGTKLCIIFGIILTLINSRLLLWSGGTLFSLFNSDNVVINKGIEIITITFPFYFLYVILEVLSASIRGMGKSIQPMIIILVNICLIRVVLLYFIVPSMNSIRGVAITYPITWATTAICMGIFYKIEMVSIRKKNNYIA